MCTVFHNIQILRQRELTAKGKKVKIILKEEGVFTD